MLTHSASGALDHSLGARRMPSIHFQSIHSDVRGGCKARRSWEMDLCCSPGHGTAARRKAGLHRLLFLAYCPLKDPLALSCILIVLFLEGPPETPGLRNPQKRVASSTTLPPECESNNSPYPLRSSFSERSWKQAVPPIVCRRTFHRRTDI